MKEGDKLSWYVIKLVEPFKEFTEIDKLTVF